MIVYLGICLCAGYFGRHRWVGFWGSFIASLVLYPVGPFMTLCLLALTRQRSIDD